MYSDVMDERMEIRTLAGHGPAIYLPGLSRGWHNTSSADIGSSDIFFFNVTPRRGLRCRLGIMVAPNATFYSFVGVLSFQISNSNSMLEFKSSARIRRTPS